uniref:Uncharacterized protein n=1 Tax=Rangifer tarandus platyrhynchus TaxID=3082113 RepID=A0ACB0FIZ3_RANTA|nr:unnamed protein product [Rangifer tarandus platyrhynchus]
MRPLQVQGPVCVMPAWVTQRGASAEPGPLHDRDTEAREEEGPSGTRGRGARRRAWTPLAAPPGSPSNPGSARKARRAPTHLAQPALQARILLPEVRGRPPPLGGASAGSRWGRGRVRGGACRGRGRGRGLVPP